MAIVKLIFPCTDLFSSVIWHLSTSAATPGISLENKNDGNNSTKMFCTTWSPKAPHLWMSLLRRRNFQSVKSLLLNSLKTTFNLVSHCYVVSSNRWKKAQWRYKTEKKKTTQNKISELQPMELHSKTLYIFYRRDLPPCSDLGKNIWKPIWLLSKISDAK